MKKGILSVAMGVVLLLSLLALKLLGDFSNEDAKNVEVEPTEQTSDSEVGEIESQ